MELVNLPDHHNLLQIIQELTIQRVSDIHISPFKKIYYRQGLRLHPYSEKVYEPRVINALLQEILRPGEISELNRSKAIDKGWEYQGRRWRVNIYSTLGGYSVAMRLIPDRALALSSYSQGEILKKLLQAPYGLILICGATGTGKSSTLAALIENMNQQEAKHIITLEDPIEYVFSEGQALVHQREKGKDFEEFAQGIKMAMREDPDVIMVGEIRDVATMKATLEAAETGHLVLGTLHASCAVETVGRVEGFFAQGEARAARQQLASVINGIIVQRLQPIASGKLVCAMEILLGTAGVKNLIRHNQDEQLLSQMQLHRGVGMQTMEEALSKIQERR